MNKGHSSIRQISSFDLSDLPDFQQKAVAWAAAFPLCTCLDTNGYPQDQYHHYDHLIAVGEEVTLIAQSGESSFEQIKQWHKAHADWLFGYLSYDLKNEIEELESANRNVLDWPDMLFFQPLVVLEFVEHKLTIRSQSDDPDTIFLEIRDYVVKKEHQVIPRPNIQPGMSKAYYLESVDSIRRHIIAGDLYEMNFCQEFFAENYVVNPLDLFQRLNAVTKSPFAAFFRWRNAYLCCASPERFLQKRDNLLVSQPIKGTIARGASLNEDMLLQQYLHESIKDRAENVMIVDLVRNDLARSCIPGSIKVNELFGIYPFEQVSHMISTVSGLLKERVHFTEAINNAFPMGSMTGAPKVISMQLIEQYEQNRRGLYSGAVGYITPDGDFDFNVVIRSMLYDAAKQYLSFSVGGAIVYDSVPEKEYEECLLKAKGMLEVLRCPDILSGQRPG